jgi:uncharacterized RDD family membrane protein YckC
LSEDINDESEKEESLKLYEKTKMYCDQCGSEYDEGDIYCPKCGTMISEPFGEGYIELATWTQRFIALIIDGIILGIVLSVLNLPGYRIVHSINIKFGLDNVLEFLYFMFMDHYYGQSLGKKVMNLRITKDGGAHLSLVDASIEAFGKVFLLPLDFLVGYFMYRDKNQRLFNYLSDTVVIRDG